MNSHTVYIAHHGDRYGKAYPVFSERPNGPTTSGLFWHHSFGVHEFRALTGETIERGQCVPFQMTLERIG